MDKKSIALFLICINLTAILIWSYGDPELNTKLYGYYKPSKTSIEKMRKKLISMLTKNEINVETRPIILLWNGPRNKNILTENFKCLITANRSLIGDSSAVIMEYKSREDRINDFPNSRLRKPKQFYILQFRETPAKYYFQYKTTGNDFLDDPRVNGIFNMTMYFRRDSDFVKNFGDSEYALIKSYEFGYNNLSSLISNKTRLAAWAVSNCNRTYGAAERLKYAKTLMKNGLDVTTFGKCFNNNNKNEDRYGFGKYKFYLAFENSIHCPDYVTEKFWLNSINLGTVPIVYGPLREDVKSLAPPNSYIHVEDFDTPQELVKYIKYLDQNDEAYLEYHKWRLMPVEQIKNKLDSRYDVPWGDIHRSSYPFHDLCRKLISKKLKPKMIHNMTDWIFGRSRYKDSLCLTPYQKPKTK